MSSLPTVAYWLDTRTTNKDGKHPLKIRITYNRANKRYDIKKFINKPVSLSKKGYEEIIVAKQKKTYDDFNKLIVAIQNSFVIIKTFSFEAFEKHWFVTRHLTDDLVDLYINAINTMEAKQVSSKDTYVNAIKSLTRFHFKNDNLKVLDKNSAGLYQKDKSLNKKFSISLITKDFLERFEKRLKTDEKPKSNATIAIYLRTLRAVYNNAIDDNLIAPESYPFGRTRSNKFSIASKVVSDKTILSANQISDLMNFDLSEDYKQVIEFSIDFWLLSFFCNGMNITDLLHLKYSDFYNASTFMFTRRKTSGKVDNKITITLIKPALEILNKYKSVGNDNGYVFHFLNGYTDAEKEKAKVHWIVKKINNGMKKVAEKMSTKNITTYDCRYTFANLARNKNVPYNYIQVAMGHSKNNSVTDVYMGEYSEEQIRNFTEVIYADFI